MWGVKSSGKPMLKHADQGCGLRAPGTQGPSCQIVLACLVKDLLEFALRTPYPGKNQQIMENH